MGNQCTQAPTDHYWDVNVRSWTPAHVYSWLSAVDKGELKSTAIIFKKHKINGNDLISISKSNKRLQSLNIAIGDRLLLKQSMKTLLIDDNLYTIPLKSVKKKLQLNPTYNHKKTYNNINITHYNQYNQHMSPRFSQFVILIDEFSDDHDHEDATPDIDYDCNWQVQNTYNALTYNPSFSAGVRPMLLNNKSSNDSNHATLRCTHGGNHNKYISSGEYNCVSNDYNTATINRDLDGEMSDIEYSQSQTYHDDVCGEDYETKIKELSTAHTATLYMLQTAKEYLLCGYLRQLQGIHPKLMYIPQGIIEVILLFFDETCMDFNVKITDLLTNKNNKLQSKAFKFDLNLDHKITFSSTLTRKVIGESNLKLNQIEISLECQELPIKIDNCMVLVNILCIFDEIKYQKIDIYMFGTDLIGDKMSYNLLNTSGLKMIIPQKDIENLDEFQFKINATVLRIEYDPKYDNFGIVPAYNNSLKMSENISYKWQLNQRIICILARDKFKQKFYSNHFNYEHWCLSCYQHDGQLILLLHLLRLQADILGIDCYAFIKIIKNSKEVVWSQQIDVHMDIKYNNSFKWKLNQNQTNKLLINDNNSSNICVLININVVKVYAKKSQTSLDIYNYVNRMDMD